MSHYADYLKETQGKEMLETEYGFLTYGFNCVPGLEVDHCYIEELYVVPSMRKTHMASTMADRVCGIAKERGIWLLVGSVNKHAKTKEASCKVLKAYGMDLFRENEDGLWFAKEIK